jgi:hypothetical protein
LTCRDATMLPGGLVQLRYEAATLPGELDEDRA